MLSSVNVRLQCGETNPNLIIGVSAEIIDSHVYVNFGIHIRI